MKRICFGKFALTFPCCQTLGLQLPLLKRADPVIKLEDFLEPTLSVSVNLKTLTWFLPTIAARWRSKKLTATSPPILCEFYPGVDCRWHDPTKWLRCPVWDPVSVPVWEPVWDHVSVPVWSLSEARFPNSADPSIFETADFLPALLLTHIQNTHRHQRNFQSMYVTSAHLYSSSI